MKHRRPNNIESQKEKTSFDGLMNGKMRGTALVSSSISALTLAELLICKLMP